MTGRRRRWPAALFVPVLALVLLFVWGFSSNPFALPDELTGTQAPAFALPRLDGGAPLRLADLSGHVVVLNFWAPWCAECRVEHPALHAAWERYRERRVALLGIVFQDSPANARAYVSELGGDWPIVLDPGTRTAVEYGVYGVPETVVIGRDGVVAARYIGPVTYDWLLAEIGGALRPAEGR